MQKLTWYAQGNFVGGKGWNPGSAQYVMTSILQDLVHAYISFWSLFFCCGPGSLMVDTISL